MTPNQPQNINHDIVRKLLLNSFASIILGIAGYFTVINWFPIFAVKTSGLEDWNLLEGFASLLSLILIIGGFTFAIAEYIGKEKDKHQEELAEEREKSKLSYEIYRTIYEKLTDPEQEAARRWILANIDIKKDDEDIVAWYENTNKTVMLKASDNEEIPEGQKSIKLREFMNMESLWKKLPEFWELVSGN